MRLPSFPFPRVTVFWTDMRGDSGWQDGNDKPDPYRCFTRGWLIHETDEFYVVASTIGKDSNGKLDWCDVNTIPKGPSVVIRKDR